MPPLRVLLISPHPDTDPPGGDVTYTQELLASPPPGVSYETHVDALSRGALRERGRRGALVDGLGTAWREAGVLARERLVNATRGTVLFREPWRFFELRDPSGWDLIHVNMFTVKLSPPALPVLVSNSADLPSHYRVARGWSEARVTRASRIESRLSSALNVIHNSLRPSPADRLVCCSRHLADWYVERGLMPADLVDVIPVGLDTPQARERVAVGRPTVGFIANDFRLKGGSELLAAWPLVRRRHPDAVLEIVGSAAVDSRQAGVNWLSRVPRPQLLDEVIPRWDVFAYPTHWDGAPVVVQEALARGVPAVVSDYGALPEMIDFGRAGVVLLDRSPAAIFDAISRVLDPDINAELRRSAHKLARSRYDRQVTTRALSEAYRAAVRTRLARTTAR